MLNSLFHLRVYMYVQVLVWAGLQVGGGHKSTLGVVPHELSAFFVGGGEVLDIQPGSSCMHARQLLYHQSITPALTLFVVCL